MRGNNIKIASPSTRCTARKSREAHLNQLWGHRQRDRRGVIIVVVLVCLVVATMIILGSVNISTRYRRQLRDDLRVEQATWLLDAGVRVAIAKVKQDPDYRGEEIFVEPELATGGTGSLSIVTLPDEVDDEMMRLQVTASLHADAHRDAKSAKNTSTNNDWSRRSRVIRRSAEIFVPRTE